jgi:hypothetical protein
MRDLARVFELTHRLHSISPLGNMATPENGLFDARLFGTTASYYQANGPMRSAGVYFPRKKLFMAPLDLMGVKEGPEGWHRAKEDYDLSTVVHELTHQLTHDMLESFPIWINEGYAEYISKIPLKHTAFMSKEDNIAFLMKRDQIRDGVIDSIMDFGRDAGRFKNPEKRMSSASERRDFLKNGTPPALVKVGSVLTMSDEVWINGPRKAPPPLPPQPGNGVVQAVEITPFSGDINRLPRLYRTAHLIIYYFIHIEEDVGVQKIRKFLEINQKQRALYDKYTEDFNLYETRLKAFRALPGVKDLGDNKFTYPSYLTPPETPKPPFSNAEVLRTQGLSALLAGETAETVGQRIENALRQDLKLDLKFE